MNTLKVLASFFVRTSPCHSPRWQSWWSWQPPQRWWQLPVVLPVSTTFRSMLLVVLEQRLKSFHWPQPSHKDILWINKSERCIMNLSQVNIGLEQYIVANCVCCAKYEGSVFYLPQVAGSWVHPVLCHREEGTISRPHMCTALFALSVLWRCENWLCGLVRSPTAPGYPEHESPSPRYCSLLKYENCQPWPCPWRGERSFLLPSYWDSAQTRCCWGPLESSGNFLWWKGQGGQCYKLLPDLLYKHQC